MIEIDDAGSGSLIGGTCIGILKRETDKFFYEIIPLSLYTPENFSKKLYQDYVIKIAKKAFDKFNVTKNEEIYVCKGYIFDKLREWLKNQSYKYQNTKIQNPLQTLVERTFENYVVSLGLPRDYITYTKYPFHFHKLLKWVYADYENRANLCKTGWRSWQKYGNLPVNVSYGYLENSKFYCLKCGKKIPDKSFVKILTYKSNRNNTIYIHDRC